MSDPLKKVELFIERSHGNPEDPADVGSEHVQPGSGAPTQSVSLENSSATLLRLRSMIQFRLYLVKRCFSSKGKRRYRDLSDTLQDQSPIPYPYVNFKI